METTEVQFGRRRGCVQRTIATETDSPAQAAVVPAAEWRRIKDSLCQRERERAEQCKARDQRQERRAQSERIVKNWENTIEGQRLKKLQARKLREEKEEERNVEIDRQEMEFQEQCRKEAIQRARTLLYHQTDRVKTFHGALLLSEVMREREAQLEYKKKKEEIAKAVDQKYIVIQQEERDKRMAADHQAALERAQAQQETAKYQVLQMAEKQRLRDEEREQDLAEQTRINKEVEQFLAAETEAVVKKKEKLVKVRGELDLAVREKAKEEAKKQQLEQAETAGIQLFQEAKKRMTRLRKEKEKEVFEEFQSQQQRMADLLQSQRLQERSNEDEIIAKIMKEQYAKKERAEQEKQQQLLERTLDIQQHCSQMMHEKERKEMEEIKANKEMLSQKRAHDLQFHQAQQEKSRKALSDARELQAFLCSQMAEKRQKKRLEEEEDQLFNTHNQHLQQVEQQQFKEYANTVLSEARKRGAPTEMLEHAAALGAGGGRGPAIAGFQPSYKATDSTAVELPNYQTKDPATPANTQKRMGFTW